MNAFLRRLRQRGDRGAVLVEMAFVAPILMLFLIGSLQVGLVVIGNSTASNAAREGARVASIRYECADNHASARCWAGSPSTNYTYIKTAVMAKLVGLVKEASVTVTVQCRRNGPTGSVVSCEKGVANLDHDIVVVTVGWRHIGATPYVADNVHTSVARSVILGRPDILSLAPEPDTIAPALTSAVVYDSNVNGVLDRIDLTFGEDLVQNVSASAFTITNSVTGSNTIASATISGRVVSLTLSGSTVNTAPGAMRIALAASATGVRDASGNQASFNATALTDAARPILTGLADTPGASNGYPNPLDTFTLTFSEPIATSLGATTIAYTDPQGGGNNNDTISISSITAGPLQTNAKHYNTNDNSTVSVSGTITKSGNDVIVKVNSPLACTPSACSGLAAGNDGSAWTFTPATGLADSAGNTVTGTSTFSNIF